MYSIDFEKLTPLQSQFLARSKLIRKLDQYILDGERNLAEIKAIAAEDKAKDIRDRMTVKKFSELQCRELSAQDSLAKMREDSMVHRDQLRLIEIALLKEEA